MYMKPIAALAAAVVSIAFTPAVSAEPIKSQILADGSSDDNKEKRVEGQEIVINVDDSVGDAVLATKGGKVYIGNDQTQKSSLIQLRPLMQSVLLPLTVVAVRVILLKLKLKTQYRLHQAALVFGLNQILKRFKLL